MSAEDQQAEQIPSVWTRPRRQREQPALSREQIVSEAVRLLDADGIESLSMRKLGTRLGAGATSLYRHVANKDELIELVVDEVYGELDVPVSYDPAGWRPAVARSAHSLRSMALGHPWVASVLGQVGLAHLGPNLMRMSDRMLALFETAGFAPDEADQAMNTVIAYVIGTATSEAAYLSLLARSGQDERTWIESLRPATDEAMKDHPRLREGHSSRPDKDPRTIREENFEYGLQRVLDGLAARLVG
ncbi:TetR/AcrR family transcriptional regulator [Streptomyces sp. ISL-11]|uniref:TetR/AcrR family transcriptional regulator n=1 Tax=Streptomyces sp. ISL-11 TaxID=2819174 RepID=UPI001BE7BF77|nr:TetR/AcrR family transcriptional regulator [Streptomyces sp. ISL-11]MBT2382657.1 TetR/AcrR family transcriptional regulator C-terminal domain-containing protein [Streptomyces sp. ISL-11]